MEKTRLGLSVGVVGAAAYLLSLFGGYIPVLLLVGYVLMFETNGWLKRTAVKAAVVTILFSMASALIGLIPDCLRLIQEIVVLFDGYFDITTVYTIESLLLDMLNLFELFLVLALGLKAFKQRTIVIGFIDSIVNKCME